MFHPKIDILQVIYFYALIFNLCDRIDHECFWSYYFLVLFLLIDPLFNALINIAEIIMIATMAAASVK
jgi:hypothetical protein